MKKLSKRVIHPHVAFRNFLASAFMLAIFSSMCCSTVPKVLVEQDPAIAERPSKADQQYPPACEQGDTPIFNIPVFQYNPVLGNSQESIITIIEFMDFQCPFCHKASVAVRQLMDSYPGKIRLVFKNNPLPFHKNALPAAKAAAAAFRQGKFWQMSRSLFENSHSLDEDHIFRLALQLGLNMKQFEHDYSAPDTLQIIENDLQMAKKFGIRGTPIFFINGRELRGAQPLSSFKAIVDELLPQAKAAGGSGDALYARVVGCGLTKRKLEIPRPRHMRPRQNPDKVYQIPAGNSYWVGGQNAPVEMIVFSDFQCPYCARLASTLKKIHNKYGNSIRIVFKNRPLPFHQNAMLASEAAMAAGAQGKFWQMHDIIFANKNKISREYLESYAKGLGLDLQRFKSDLDKHAFSHAIEQDLELAKKFGINGTPTTFINGRKLSGARPLDDFAEAIDKALGH